MHTKGNHRHMGCIEVEILPGDKFSVLCSPICCSPIPWALALERNGVASGSQCQAVREARSKFKNWVPGPDSAFPPDLSPIGSSLLVLSTKTSAYWVLTS